MKTKYPEKEYLGIAGLPEFVKSSVELAYNPDQSLFDRVANMILIIIQMFRLLQCSPFLELVH
jgi:hypothetical protein